MTEGPRKDLIIEKLRPCRGPIFKNEDLAKKVASRGH